MNVSIIPMLCFLYFIASSEDISLTFTEVVEKISGVIKVMEELVPKMSEDDSKKLGDIIERELKQMDLDIEEAAQRIQVCNTLPYLTICVLTIHNFFLRD